MTLLYLFHIMLDVMFNTTWIKILYFIMEFFGSDVFIIS